MVLLHKEGRTLMPGIFAFRHDRHPCVRSFSTNFIQSFGKWLILSMMFIGSMPLPAFERLEGSFQAIESCPAGVGLHRFPDAVSLIPGTRYPLLGLNRSEGDYVEIRLNGVHPEARWVLRRCGVIEAATSSSSSFSVERSPRRGLKGLVLALSWQPAFCETHGEKNECKDLSAERFDANHFALHGLWPEPRGLEYCETSASEKQLDEARDWLALRPVTLHPELGDRLRVVMPGSRSGLDRHEWVRHGRCFSDDPSRYFETALRYLDAVNSSRLQQLFKAHVGERLSAEILRREFDQSFGSDAGRALELICTHTKGRPVYSEIRVYLKAPPEESPSFAEILDREHDPLEGCQEGLVDPMLPGTMSPKIH